MKGLTPGFLKVATPEDRALRDRVIERWTHLLQEIRERGIDTRFFSPGMQSMGARIRAGELPRTTLAEIEIAGHKALIMDVGRYYPNSGAKTTAA